MSMDITAFAGCALAVCAIAVVVRQYKPETAIGVSIAAAVVMTCCLVCVAAPVLERLRRMSAAAGESASAIAILIKCLGICLIAQTAADICRDCGESSIAGHVETAGRIFAAVVALPLFENVLTLAGGLAGR